MSQQSNKPDKIISYKQIMMYVIIGLFLLFCLTNLAPVRVNLLFAQFNAPLVVVILVSAGVGVLVSWIFSTLKHNKQ